MTANADHHQNGNVGSRSKLALIDFLAAAGFFLLPNTAPMCWESCLTCFYSSADALFMYHGHGNQGHPQYDAFVLIMFGFLLQWPTMPTLLWMYVHLARHEEREAVEEFGDAYIRYIQKTTAFFRIWGRRIESGVWRVAPRRTTTKGEMKC